MIKKKFRTTTQTRAVSKLSSWLTAVKIPHKADSNLVLLVTTAQNQMVAVTVDSPERNEESSMAVAFGTLYRVPFKAFWDRDAQTAMQVFHDLTSSLGYGTPCPLPPRKLKAPEDLTLYDYWIRHTEFNISPNPPEHIYHRYAYVIEYRIRKFYSTNKYLLEEIGWDEEDVRSIVRIWVTSFECLHKVLVTGPNGNDKLLHNYLKQRFAELHTRMKTLAEDTGYSCVPREDHSAFRQLKNTAVEPTYNQNQPEGSLADLEETSSYVERKTLATRTLKDSLRRMPQNIAIKKLEELATRPNIDPTVASQASLYLHRLTRKRGANKT